MKYYCIVLLLCALVVFAWAESAQPQKEVTANDARNKRGLAYGGYGYPYGYHGYHGYPYAYHGYHGYHGYPYRYPTYRYPSYYY